MTFPTSLLAWANIPFVVALGVALIFFLLQITGVLGLVMGGGDHDADADHDAETGHEADADHDADHDADGNHGNIGKDLLAGIGVGTMPLSVVWQTFTICFGAAGILANSVYLDRTGTLPAYTLAWTVPIAALAGFAVNHGLSRLFARLVVPPDKASTSRKDLVGRTGVVISSKVNHEFGEVRTVDRSGDTLRLIVKTLDQDEVVEEGREVVFVEYDPRRDALFVAALDDDAPRARLRVRGGAKVRVLAEPTPARPPPEEPQIPDAAVAGGERGTTPAS